MATKKRSKSYKPKVGDKVTTIMGSRLKTGGRKTTGKIVDVNRSWKDYPAVLVERTRGKRVLMLKKNIKKVK